MKNLFFIIFFLTGKQFFAQVTTFSRTYRDTFNLSCISSRPVETDSGVFMVAGAGYGLGLNQGGYQRILAVNDVGEKLLDNFRYDTTRRFHGKSCLAKCADGNILLAGTRTRLGGTGGNRVFVLKLTADLSDTLWSYYHSDSSYFDITTDLIETTSGDIVSVINRDFFGADSTTGLFLRLNAAGVFQAEGGIRQKTVQHPTSVELMADGNFIISGCWGSSDSQLTGFLLKLTPDGETIWSQDYPQVTEAGMSKYDESSVILSGYIAGSFRSKIVKVELEGGGVLFNKIYSFPLPTANYIGRRVTDGGIISVGITDYTTNEGYILKTDAVGSLLWHKRYNWGEHADFFTDFIETRDGGLLVSGSASEDSQEGGQNSWLIKLDANGCLDAENCGVGVEDMPLPDAVTIYPNPASEWLNIKIENPGKPYRVELLDASGRMVQRETFSQLGTHTLHLSGLANGIYYCRILQGDDVVVVEKVVKV